MVTRSIVGRFLILAVLLVSLGVIAQAALIISKNSSKATAKASGPAVAAAVPTETAPVAPKIAINAQTPSATPAASAQASTGTQPAAVAVTPIRVVYPGPLGDAPVQPRRATEVASAAPSAPAPAPLAAAASPTPQQAQPAPAVAAVQPAAPAATPAPVVLASAETDAQPAVADAAAGKGGVNLNNASVDALNHLGGGHIGQTIVQHRPYRSVEDLVKKRVVRRSVYEQIKGQVAAQ